MLIWEATLSGSFLKYFLISLFFLGKIQKAAKKTSFFNGLRFVLFVQDP